jgi:hypothetical protein
MGGKNQFARSEHTMLMTRFLNRKSILSAVLPLLLCTQIANAQGTSFTYQGKLSNSGNPATGSFDMQFKVFDALTDGTQQGATVTNPAVMATAGIFTVELDFGAGVFDGAARYLEICVRPEGSPDPYTVLAPRQSITSIPYAMHSLKAAAADGLSAACVNCVTGEQVQSIDGAQITGAVSGSQISGAIPIESVPTGSNNYIQNAAVALSAGRPAVTQEGDIDVTGFGKFGGNLIVSGNAGIGFSDPLVKLHVLSSALGVPAIYAESDTSRAVWGKSVGSRGVYGESTNGEGVFGISTNASGVYGESAAVNTVVFSGVAGRATGSGGAAVVGLATGSGAFGVYGESATGRAVYGKSVGSRGVYGESTNGEGVFGISTNASGVHGIANNASGVGGYFQNNSGGGTALLVDGSGKILFSGTGFVGIGTPNPTTPLHLEGSGGIAATIRSINERAILALDSNTPAGGRRVWTLESGFEGTSSRFAIYDQTALQARLTIDPAGTVGVNVLQIQGGSDFSETFDVRGPNPTQTGTVSVEVERGLVVSIDTENPGKLVVSRRAYDRSVAGIISGAGGITAGLVMGQQGSIADGKQPVALTGRVCAYCDARRNPINPGDLLTTSTTPGHAMRARDYRKAQGAIIGKAMTGLKSGRGLVLVLVTLQ